MNYLKTYEGKFWNNNQEILDTISDILLDAIDDGFDADVKVTYNLRNEYRILIVNKTNSKHNIFNYDEIKDVMERLVEYLKSNGIDSFIEIYGVVWHPIYINTYQKSKIKGARIKFILPFV